MDSDSPGVSRDMCNCYLPPWRFWQMVEKIINITRIPILARTLPYKHWSIQYHFILGHGLTPNQNLESIGWPGTQKKSPWFYPSLSRPVFSYQCFFPLYNYLLCPAQEYFPKNSSPFRAILSRSVLVVSLESHLKLCSTDRVVETMFSHTPIQAKLWRICCLAFFCFVASAVADTSDNDYNYVNNNRH